MRRITTAALAGLGIIVAGAAQAQTVPAPGAAWQNYPVYNYGYTYPGYTYYYSYPNYGYAYQWPYTRDYLGQPYPSPLAFWDPYVGYRPYSDNAGPKASGHGNP